MQPYYQMQETNDLGYLATTLNPGNDTAYAIWGLVSTAAMGSAAYHGYKRNNSVGWAIGWGLLGAICPVITIPVAIAQGFGEPKVG